MRILFVLFTASCTLMVSSMAQKIDPASGAGYSSIKAADLSRYLHVIASDSMEGRETAMDGQKKAARYIADHFRTLGLKPVGDDGTYFQHFDVVMTSVDPVSSFLSVRGQKHSFGDGYFTTSQTETTVVAPAVFVGFADTKIDPALREKMSGRIVITLPGTRDQLADTSARGQMMRLFARRDDIDAVAQVVVADREGQLSFEVVSERFAGMAGGSMSRADLPASGRRRGGSVLRLFISSRIADEILSGSGSTLDQLRQRAATDDPFTPVFLDDASITITNVARREVKQTENVLGFLEGSDPVLRNQVVALTAHYDHLGMRSDGVINNGADDDGSGTVTILELAEAFVTNGTRPKRSMLFMTVAGEEKGLLGSGYYTDHPVFPLDETTANLNIDMIGRIGSEYMPMNDSMYVYVIGSDKISTDLDDLLRQANEETVNLKLDYTYNDENDPNRFYYRSDHYNFAKNGVPVTFFFTGTHPDYHRPTDTLDKILYERMAMIARLVYTTAWKVANNPAGLRKNVPAAR